VADFFRQTLAEPERSYHNPDAFRIDPSTLAPVAALADRCWLDSGGPILLSGPVAAGAYTAGASTVGPHRRSAT
jgi:hypothetical protein